jgi:hypothetical protein
VRALLLHARKGYHTRFLSTQTPDYSNLLLAVAALKQTILSVSQRWISGPINEYQNTKAKLEDLLEDYSLSIVQDQAVQRQQV